MGAAFCLNEGFTIAPDTPLKLQYLLYSHRGNVDLQRATSMLADFEKFPLFEIVKSAGPHRQFETKAVEANR